MFEVPKNNLSTTRLSPLLVAVCAAATVNLPATAQGKTLDPVQSHAVQDGFNDTSLAARMVSASSQSQIIAPSRANASMAQAAPPGEQNEPTIQFPPGESPQSAPPSPQVEPPSPDNQTDPAPTPAPGAQTGPDIQFPTIESTPAPEGVPTPTESPQPAAPEPQVLVGEVVVQGVEGELQNTVYQAIQTRPGRTTTRSQLQEDINAIFATGYFANVRAEPSDTPLGVRVTFQVEPNPVLRSVRAEDTQIATQQVIDSIFGSQYGRTLNLQSLQAGIQQLNKYYQDRGYVLGQVVSAPQVSPEGIVTLQIAEGVIEDIQVRYLNKDDQPTKGRTRPFIITRELNNLKVGNALNRNAVQQDLRRVFGLGIFEDVQLALEPGKDPRRVVAVLNIKERKSGQIGAGAGFSSGSGLFGSVNYSQQNLGGNNQKLNAEVQIGPRQREFDISFTDPWIAGDPFRTSYTVNLFNRYTRPYIFDGGEREVNLPNGDNPRLYRLGGALNFTRPLSGGWSVSVGPQYQRVSVRDADRELSPVDELGNQLSFSGSGRDDLLTVQASAVRDRRDNALTPTKGSLLRFGVEQSVPVGSGSILLNRLRGSYSYYIPLRLLKFSQGPQALAFNVQAGTIFGDLPPYEAFTLGGTNTVRGYGEGEVGAGRSSVVASAEYRFPVFSAVGGALFVDFGSDLGTGNNVPGDPAGVRGKPGSGLGYGVGVRVRSPLGPIRVDYGFNQDGGTRLHFGIGERF